MKYCSSTITDILRPLPESVTVCATVDEAGDEHVITELMIRRACEQMDAHQLWPCADNKVANVLPVSASEESAKIIAFPRLLN